MFGALLKGWSGFGTNLVVPPLLLFLGFPELKEVMVIVVSVNLFLNLTMIFITKKFNLQFLYNLLPLVITGVLFNFVGAFIATEINNTWFKVLLGIMIILVTANKVLKLNFHIENPRTFFIPTGIISGILNGMFGLGGIPVLILLSSTKMEKNEFKTTLVTYFFVMNLIYIVSQATIGGLYSPLVFSYIGYVFVFTVVACLIGVYMSNRVPDKWFQRVMNIVLIFFGLNLIYSGFTGEHIFNLLF